MRSLNKYVRTSSHSDELTGDFGNKPEAILIGDHFLSCLLAEKLSLRDLRLLQQYRHIADIRGIATFCPLLDASSTGRCNTGVKSLCWGFELQGLTRPFV